MLSLDEWEEDALKEFFNMGLGMAADSLSRMVNNEVLLSLPQLAVVSHEEAVHMLGKEHGERMVAIRQNFSGSLSGTALLIFPGAKSLELVRTLLGDQIPLEILIELEQETLLDVGNVILNAFLASFTQMMAVDFDFEEAEFLRGGSEFLLSHASHYSTSESGSKPGPMGRTFLLMMDFKTQDQERRERTLNGFVALLFSQEAIVMLKRELAVIMHRL